MSWYISKVGTVSAVKADIRRNLEALKNQNCPVEFIESCLDSLSPFDKSQNGVIVEGNGHNGQVAALKIQPIVLCAEDVLEPPTGSGVGSPVSQDSGK